MSRFKDRVVALQEQLRRPERLGAVAANGLAILCWCNRCGHHARLESRALSLALGPAFAVPEIGARLRCSHCGAKDVATKADTEGQRAAPETPPTMSGPAMAG